MSYKNNSPNGKLYVGNVKWSNDYKNVMLFASKTARNTFFENHLSLIKENLICINPNRYVDINSKLQGVEQYNYLYYINDSDISNTHYCCFITDYEYIAPNTTRLYIELDVFQMYHYDATYYQSFIERAIVSPAENNANKNYLPEPVNAPLEYEKELTSVLSSDSDWQPVWVLHCASKYNSTTGEYDYSGTGTNNTYGEYGFFISSKAALANIIKMYGRQTLDGAIEQVQQSLQDSGSSVAQTLLGILSQWLGGGIAAGSTYQDNKSAFDTITDTLSFAQFQDHRDELVGLYAIPKWLKDAYGSGSEATNERQEVSDNLTINSNSLANGYTPRNKKLLTSVCRAYLLINRTGLQIPFKPELFTGSPTITLYGITMSTSGYQFKISNYADLQKSYGEVAYHSERRVGYDANTGINKALAIIGAGAGIASSASQIASGNPAAIASGVGVMSQNLVNAIDALGTKEAHFGNNGDLLRITGGRPRLRWVEVSPTLSECQAIDSFFDMYGYTIQQHKSPSSYFHNRSKWNYIKTDSINLRVQAPANYENILKSVFNGGVTIWHDYDHFGDYSQTNGSPS